MSILAVHEWPTNAELIADVAQLYIAADAEVLDLTYGHGVWWRQFRPDRLWAMCADGGFTISPGGPVPVVPDFRHPPDDWGGRFDVVAFDPPYISTGGRETSTIDEFNEAYGLSEAERTPRLLHEYNMVGLERAAFCAAPAGLILVKCMNYVSSAKLQTVTQWTLDDAAKMRLKLVDWFIHKGDPGPQPLTDKCRRCDGTGWVTFGSIEPDVLCPEVLVDCPTCERAGEVPRRQVHARQNASHLFVFKTPGRKRRKKKGPAT